MKKITLEQVALLTKDLITKKTDLNVKIIQNGEDSFQLHAHTKLATLGYTTVTKSLDGEFIIGGTSTGAFLHSHFSDCLYSILNPEFKSLEKKANEETISISASTKNI